MGSHKQSFQCFDAILDDPSLKPSLSYGHRSAASHMSSPCSNRVEPLEDRGCYLCADHQQATSMTSEASGAYSTPWYHFQTYPHSHHYSSRRPTRPEEAGGGFEDHPYPHHKLSRRIVLVKNSDPSVRRTIVLHRRSLRSLEVFMDEVSELMQSLIRKLYTLDGRKIDSVQSLLECASVLVCVGREPFHPLLFDSFRKNSNDKLPKLNIKSRSSASIDDKGAKKNVNFGLETKKTIIHPRCDLNSRSARFSSEKSFPCGLNSLPLGHAGTQVREGMMDDDIEKRVLVNKDGSLSMEMKVRFRLLHDETLHWSTEIKKSTSTLNECNTAHDDTCFLSHDSAESCSEVESPSAGEVEETCNTKRYQRHFERSHCPHCCAKCQEYDIWKSPTHPEQTAVRHIRSSSSSASSRRIVYKKASSDSIRTMSSEEYTEHVVEKLEQTYGTQGDASIKHCTINCCCRGSQVISSKSKNADLMKQKYEVPEKTSDSDESKPDRKDSQKEQLSVHTAQPIVEDERPVSTVSSSSQILAALKEDQDEEDVDILLSISRASHNNEHQKDEDAEDSKSNTSFTTPCRSPASMTLLSPKPPSKASPLGRFKTCRKLTPTETDQDGQNIRPCSAESALSGSKKCKCLHSKDTEKSAFVANTQPEDSELKIDVNHEEVDERAYSKTSAKSPSKLSVSSQNDTEYAENHQDITDERASSAISSKSNTSEISGKSNVEEVFQQECSAVKEERAPSSISIKSHQSDDSEILPQRQKTEMRPTSVMSDTSVKSKRSKISENDFDDLVKLRDNVEERTRSPMACKSNMSEKSSRSRQTLSETEEQIEERSSSVNSAMSSKSGIGKLKDQVEERALSALSLKSNTSERSKLSFEFSELEEHEKDRLSVNSHVSQKTKSDISEATSYQTDEEGELQERAASATSATSVQSLKSTPYEMTVLPQDGQAKEKSIDSLKADASLNAVHVESELPGERSPSSMSSISHISKASEVSELDESRSNDKGQVQERESSPISAKSHTSSSSRKFKTKPTATEISGEEINERALSALSSKSKASLKSNKSKVSPVAPVDMEETEKRASSAMSSKSEVEQQQRASSTISVKSNVSETSKESKVSKLQVQDSEYLFAVPHTSETLNTSNDHDMAAKETQERTLSELSTKYNTSGKSKKSKASNEATVDVVAKIYDLRSGSAMSSNFGSAHSVKSEFSELVTEKSAETDYPKEDRPKSNELGTSVIPDGLDDVLSIISSKSNESQRSKKSNISKVKCQTEEQAKSALSEISNVSKKSSMSSTAVKADAKEKEDRVSSAMSGRSGVSAKSSISTRSKESKTYPKRPDDTDHEDGTATILSMKSSVSARSHKTKNLEYDNSAEVKIDNQERPSSAISSISNTSTKSGRSITSEATHSENKFVKSNSTVGTRKLKGTEIIDEPSERASSSRSLKSDVSKRSEKFNALEASPTNLVNEDEDKKERAESVSSSISRVSGRSRHSEIMSDVTGSYNEERAPSVTSVSSVKSKSSNISSITPKETEITGNRDAEGSLDASNMPAKTYASTKSKSSLFSEGEESEGRSTSVLSSKSAESKVSSAVVENKSNRSESQLSAKSNVSTRSKKSKDSQGQDHGKTHTNKSPVSGGSKVSQAGSNQCVCGAIKSTSMLSSEKNHEETPASPTKSAKSKSTNVSLFERTLTPTTDSVSIGIVGDFEADDVEKIDEDVISVKSRTSASSEIKIFDRSEEGIIESPTRMMNERATVTPEERPKSAKSNISHKSKSKHSHCSNTDTVLDTNHRDKPSSFDSVRQSSQTQEIRSSSIASSVSVHTCRSISAENTGTTGQGSAESTAVRQKSKSICSKCSSTQNIGKVSTELVAATSPVTSASGVSDSKIKYSEETIDRSKSNDKNMNVEATVKNGEKGKKSCKSTQTNEETLSITSANLLSPSPPKSHKKSKKPIVLLEGSKDSVLSQTVPDNSEENVATGQLNCDRTYNGRPNTTESIQDVTDNSEKSSTCRKRLESSSSCQRMNDELNPSCLPNTSPTEVVNEWLRKIPSDAALCDFGNEFHENFDVTEPLCTLHMPLANNNEHRDSEENGVTKPEKQKNVDDAHPASDKATVDKTDKTENVSVCENNLQCFPPQAGNESRVLDSSVLVMKVLLSPQFERCNSLPEVSPVYGRKLSRSAQGLLDCLAKLQLLDFGPSDGNGKKAKYQELMHMLKSLWLSDPKERFFLKDQQPLDEEFKARSSSGVDVNSGSTSSGKSSVLGGNQAQASTDCEGPDTLTKVPEVVETVQEESSDTPESNCESATPDKESQAQWTPVGVAKDPVEEKAKDETISNNDSPREIMETPPSSNQSSENTQNNETETDILEDASSGSPTTTQRPQLSKRVSQDPDPLWVLNLLNKLEKQFMTHYVNAMGEFKVRWNLDDNDQLDVMICELQDAVRKRIQSSVNKEIKKIQGRAGRPRPPKEVKSRESTVQTEQRRRRLKVMQDQSVEPQSAKSEDEYTATGTDFSDQRSDDEYCPCDTCLKKKMASKPVVPVEVLNSAPVMPDFDLRRILQSKKCAPNHEKTASECKVSKIGDTKENVTLEAVKEEDDIEGLDSSTAQEFENENDKEEKKGDDCEMEEDALSTYDEDTSERQSDMSEHLRPDMNEEVEAISSMEEVRAGKISDIMMHEQLMEAEKENKEKNDNETYSENDNTGEDVSDAMQAETGREKNKEWEQEKDTEQERNKIHELEGDAEAVDYEKTEKEIKTLEGETAEESETADSETAEETAEAETAEDREISEIKSGEERETAADVAAEESGISEVQIAEESETAEDETAEEGEISEVKTAEESETAEDETAEECETAEAETAEECETAEAETEEEGKVSQMKNTVDSETAEDETSEEGEEGEVEIPKVKPAMESETDENEIGEESERAENKTAEENETAEDETAEEVESSEVKSARESETTEAEMEEECGEVANKTIEESETAEDDIAEEVETAEYKTSKDSETDEDKTTEEGEISEVKTVEESESVEYETAKEGETAENKNTEENETAEDETAEEGEISEVQTAEESETLEDETAEVEISEVKTAEESETAEDETVEDSQISEYETSEKDEISELKSAKESYTAEDETAEESETAEDKTTEEGETAEDENVEDSQTSEDETSEKVELSELKSAKEGDTAENETAEKSETAVSKTVDKGQQTDDAAEEADTAKDDTEEGSETGGEKTSEGGQNFQGDVGENVSVDDIAKNGETSEAEIVEETETDDEKNTEKSEKAKDETAEESEAPTDDTQDAHETSVDESVEDDKTTGQCFTGDEETVTDGQLAERESAKEDHTAYDETTQDEWNDETTAKDSETSDHENTDEVEPVVEDGQDETANSIDDKDETAHKETTEVVEELAEQTANDETAEEETAKSQSELEEVKEAVGYTEDVLSDPEDIECDDVIELKSDEKVVKEETYFKNEGDVVIDSVEDTPKEHDVKDLGDEGFHFANIGESAEGGDEAEDDTEPDLEKDEGEPHGKVQASQSILQPKQDDVKKDKTTVTSFDLVVNHNSLYDADVEDSETEVHNQIQDLSSESETKPMKKTGLKTFKTLIRTLAFLKPTTTQHSHARENEEGDDKEEHEDTPEGSDNTEDSSYVDMEDCGKEKGKLSDITEDTAEDGHETETSNTTKEYSGESEWEASENALERQFTKSSVESQPGSFEEVLNENVKGQKSSYHVAVKGNQ